MPESEKGVTIENIRQMDSYVELPSQAADMLLYGDEYKEAMLTIQFLTEVKEELTKNATSLKRIIDVKQARINILNIYMTQGEKTIKDFNKNVKEIKGFDSANEFLTQMQTLNVLNKKYDKEGHETAHWLRLYVPLHEAYKKAIDKAEEYIKNIKNLKWLNASKQVYGILGSDPKALTAALIKNLKDERRKHARQSSRSNKNKRDDKSDSTEEKAEVEQLFEDSFGDTYSSN